jgi:hypothetical protein
LKAFAISLKINSFPNFSCTIYNIIDHPCKSMMSDFIFCITSVA